MDNNETIIITTVTEKVKFTELTERERIIWHHGYNAGESDKGRFRALVVILSIGVILFLVKTIFF